MSSPLVWYAAYGSNLSRLRFASYLCGGTPGGATYACPGCRDASDPVDDRPWEIPRELAFGGTSQTWGGGVAFVDSRAEAPAKARLYLITTEQFEDVVAQENWLPCGSVRLPEPFDEETIIGFEHVYGTVLKVAEIEDLPVLTITQARGTSVAPPTARYLRHIADGLRESHGMSDAAIVDYLIAKRGVRGAFSAEQLLSAVRPSHD